MEALLIMIPICVVGMLLFVALVGISKQLDEIIDELTYQDEEDEYDIF